MREYVVAATMFGSWGRAKDLGIYRALSESDAIRQARLRNPSMGGWTFQARLVSRSP